MSIENFDEVFCVFIHSELVSRRVREILPMSNIINNISNIVFKMKEYFSSF